MNSFLKSAVAVTALVVAGTAGVAQEVTLRVHHFMGQKAPLHSKFLVPFAENVAKASDGRIKIEIFDSMSRGGAPSGLFDRAVDGADEMVLTLPGYTAGRFGHTEVFELPFIMSDSVATSKAYWDLIESDLQKGELQDVKVLAGWVHGPGLIHSKKPINKLEDVKGMELRGPTRLVTDFLGEIGASPVGMPLPKIPENLSKGVISGATLPWEVTPSIKLAEFVKNHTEFAGSQALYTSAFILAMNWDAYNEMPADLQKILDDQTGKALSQFAGEVMVGADAFGKSVAKDNNIITLPQEEVDRWVAASQPVYDRWIERASEKGFDGTAAIAQAKELIDANR
ncbi:MAG: C4-dicarboxylate ABC transporter [Rhodobacteraceae bacterium]|nr:MAG: C4-dicarboxylate ABC transporter [Paracoccaceae bacterium]